MYDFAPIFGEGDLPVKSYERSSKWNQKPETNFGNKKKERVSQEEQNGAYFSLIAPSREELWVWKDYNP